MFKEILEETKEIKYIIFRINKYVKINDKLKEDIINFIEDTYNQYNKKEAEELIKDYVNKLYKKKELNKEQKEKIEDCL